MIGISLIVVGSGAESISRSISMGRNCYPELKELHEELMDITLRYCPSWIEDFDVINSEAMIDKIIASEEGGAFSLKFSLIVSILYKIKKLEKMHSEEAKPYMASLFGYVEALISMEK